MKKEMPVLGTDRVTSLKSYIESLKKITKAAQVV